MQIVTDTYLAPGQTLRSGALLAGVSGRPVIGLELPFKLYRDIRGGDSGTDVEHLHETLGAGGHARSAEKNPGGYPYKEGGKH